METPTVEARRVDRSGEPRTLTALWLESIALRHQIAVLQRSRTRRPRFRLWDRMFWVLFSRWWPQWRDSLILVQPETVLRRRREGWSALWRYRSRGRWRGGRPRISDEVRDLIARMARENFLWGAPGSMASFKCAASLSRRRLSRATFLNQADGAGNCGEHFFATKPWRSLAASFTKSGQAETLARTLTLVGPCPCDRRLRRLR